MKACLILGLTAAALVGVSVPATAQLTSSVPVTTARTNQSLAGAAVGNGRVQGQSVAAVQSNGQPAVGVGALSGKTDHFGSVASVSAANNARLLGVDGPGGYNSGTSVSVSNPRQAPVLSSRH